MRPDQNENRELVRRELIDQGAVTANCFKVGVCGAVFNNWAAGRPKPRRFFSSIQECSMPEKTVLSHFESSVIFLRLPDGLLLRWKQN
jgi:hypothetical protein